MGETANIIIADTIQGLGTDAYSGLSCTCPLSVRNLPVEVQWRGARATCRRPDDCPQRKTGRENSTSEDFRVKVIYIASGFVVLSTPQNNYGMKGATFPYFSILSCP